MKADFPFVVIWPHCPKEKSWIRNPEEVAAALELLDTVQSEFHTDPDRVHLAGLSSGADGVWAVGAKHADHWNVWGGPAVLARKGAILDQHCNALERDPAVLSRSANMVLKFTDDQAEVHALGEMVANRMGRHADDAHDTCLAGTTAQITDKLGTLREAGVDTLFLPTMFSPADEFRDYCDRFMEEIAPQFR